MRIGGQLPADALAPKRSEMTSRGDAVFRVDAGKASARPSAGTAVHQGIDSVQGLMALQEISEPAHDRRKQAARRGFRLLDALGMLKIGLLAGKLDDSTLNALRQGLAEARGAGHERDLSDILTAIDVRAAVELAKLGR